MSSPFTVQEIIAALEDFWVGQGYAILPPLDLEVGAGTFHPGTFLAALGPKPWFAGHLQTCRRPTDGRYGLHPNRCYSFYQYQLVAKPVPADFQDIYLNSLLALGLDFINCDIRFVEDNWEGPTLGAWGLGWEVWINGMEITQFTYFQQVGMQECVPVMGELAYGILRIAQFIQGVDHNDDLIWANTQAGPVSFKAMQQRYEQQLSEYNFNLAAIQSLQQQFVAFEQQCELLLNSKLELAAYELVLKLSHIFNILDARNAIAVTERQNYLHKIRNLARQVANLYSTADVS